MQNVDTKKQKYLQLNINNDIILSYYYNRHLLIFNWKYYVFRCFKI